MSDKLACDTSNCKTKFSDFLASVLTYMRAVWVRPVKLPVTFSTAMHFSFVIRLLVLFILKNVFILLEIILVSVMKL